MAIPAALETRLRHLGRLGDGWDSEGGRAITPFAVDQARELLAYCLGANPMLPREPFISPAPDGGLAIEWNGDDGVRELVLAISPDDSRNARFLAIDRFGWRKSGAVERLSDLDEIIGRVWPTAHAA